jgi:hypothetical protein
VIFIIHQYAYLDQDKTIHSSCQLESLDNNVDDQSRNIGEKQRITMTDGHYVPLTILHGLPYLQLRPPTDHELDNLPHIILTTNKDWDPSILDNHINHTDTDWYHEDKFLDPYGHHPFNLDGSYKYQEVNNLQRLIIDDSSDSNINPYYSYHAETTSDSIDYSTLQPKLGWISTTVIEHTFKNTTHYVCKLHLYGKMRKHYKSRFPAFNVIRQNETVATDTIFQM